MTRRGPRRHDHVAFDLDGTLVDTRADLAAATNHVLRSFGRAAIPPKSVLAFVGEGARRLVERALGPDDQTLVDEGVRRFLAYYGDHLLDEARLYDGIATVLERLADAGVMLSVLTNKPEGMSRTILTGLGIARHLRGVVGGDTLPTRKPDPAGLAWLRGLTGTPPERTLLVGDSPVDVATAANDRADFCGVGWGLDPEALRAVRPCRVVERADEVVAVVVGG